VIGLWPSTVRSEHQTFRTFTGEDGLSQLSVQGIVQDTDGQIWVATQAGLNRFDGQRFEVFGPAEGLSHSQVTALVADPEGGVYVGTHAGIDHFQDGRLQAFSAARGLRPGEVRTLAMTPDGALWCATDGGLAVLRDDSFEYPPDLQAHGINDLLVASDGALWVATATTMIWRVTTAGIDTIPVPARNGVTALAQGPDGRIYAGGEGEIFTIEADEVIQRASTETPGSPVVFAIYVDARGGLWWGDGVGLAYRRGGHSRRVGPADELKLSSVQVIARMRDGQIWVGGFGGLAQFVGQAFTTFDTDDGLPSANTRPILRTSDGTLWVGTADGLARRRGGRFEALSVQHGLPGRYIITLAEDRQGRLWVGTDRGLALKTADAGFQAQSLGPGPDDGAVSAIREDSDGRIWVGQADRGIYRIDPQGSAELVPIANHSFSLPRILVARDGRVWLSADDGLLLLEGDEVRHYGVADGLAHDSPAFIVEDEHGHIWFSYRSGAGLTRFDGKEFRTWTTQDGLAHNSVYSLGFDSHGVLWVGSARGVDRFDGTYFRNYGPQEGFASTESNTGGFLCEPKGQIWFGTAEGLSRYDPELDLSPRTPLRVSLRSVRLASVDVIEDGQQVAYQHNSLKVHVQVVDFGNPRRRSIRLRLLGLSERWMSLSDPTWSVPMLAAGTYTLQVQARRHDEPWSPVVSRTFEVSAPWWRSWWAIVGWGLLICGLVYGGARWRMHVLASHNRRLQEMVADRTAVLEAHRAELEQTQSYLKTSNQELRAANRTKSEFVANVSHEIRTPMNGILGMTELALHESLSPRVREYLETVQYSGQALLQLINDILDISRMESGRLELDVAPMSIRELVEGVRRSQALAAEAKNVDLAVQVDADTPDRWSGDAGRLRQVVMNLVGNAVKFTRVGFVRVVVDLPEPEAKHAPQAVLRIRVQDSGVGIPPEKQDSIFEKFTQADGSTTREFGGTGLGLAISRQLVSLMGGQLKVHSEPGVGSTFTLEVPLTRLNECPVSVAPRASSATQMSLPIGDGLRVLVAEDNAVNQMVVRRMLERLGHSVRVVEDGLQAVAVVAEEDFDLVLMDVQMPELDGIEATRRIRSSGGAWAGVPIIALTAHAMAGDRERTLAAGLDGYLTKPLSPMALQEALAQLEEVAS